MHRIEIAQQVIDISLRRRGQVQPFATIEQCKTALLAVYTQTGFVGSDAAAEIPAAREIAPNINRLAARAPTRGRNGGMDRFDLWARRGEGLADVLQLHCHGRDIRSFRLAF
ncbi:hypothetical protein [Methylocapsa sp. S129]|uniref:hypothetical protein n=1 Tax=Methylocapsa sp. S129 TaxID=1641869 RepID=UPI00131BAF43|nr:hypothetical protein [Methylocapsa sp. S129]